MSPPDWSDWNLFNRAAIRVLESVYVFLSSDINAVLAVRLADSVSGNALA